MVATAPSVSPRCYSFGEFTLDLDRGALLRRGVDVELRPKSFEVLRVLVERHGRLVTKQELLDAVWGRVVVTEGSVAKCLIEIRRAIEDRTQQLIKTVPRRGYIFDAPVINEDPPALQETVAAQRARCFHPAVDLGGGVRRGCKHRNLVGQRRNARRRCAAARRGNAASANTGDRRAAFRRYE